MKLMDKLALGALIVGVGMIAAFGGTRLWERVGAPAEDKILAYVPADTLLFFGGPEPFPGAEYLKSFGDIQNGLNERQLIELLTELEEAPAAARFALALVAEAQSQSQSQPEDVLRQMGIPASGRSALYTIGAAPVVRMELADPALFESFIKRVEQRAGVTAQTVSFRDISYRRYLLTTEEEAGAPVYLAVGVRDGIATALLEGEDLGGDEAIALAFGLERPAESLAGNGQLRSLIDAHGYLPSAVGYLSHRQIMKGLLDPEGNRLSALINRALADSEHPGLEWLRQIRTDGCRQDLLAMAELWPQTSLGFTQLELGDSPSAEFLMVVESRDPAAMALLQALRGHIPSHASNADDIGLLGMAFGLDVSAIPAALQKGWQRMADAKFSCPALQQMQLAAQDQNPAMVGAFLGMVSSIKGASLVVRDLELSFSDETPMPEVTKASGLITLSADNPAVLLGMAAGFVPGLGEIAVPEDGTPVALPLPPEYGLSPMLAISGSHLVMYVGEEVAPTVAAMKSETLQANGFFSTSLDYGRYGRLGKQVVASPMLVGTPGIEDMQQMMDDMAASQLKAVLDVDFQPRGVVMRTRLRAAER